MPEEDFHLPDHARSQAHYPPSCGRQIKCYPEGASLGGRCKLLHLVGADVDVRPGEARQAALVGAEVIRRAGDAVVAGINGRACTGARSMRQAHGRAEGNSLRRATIVA